MLCCGNALARATHPETPELRHCLDQATINGPHTSVQCLPPNPSLCPTLSNDTFYNVPFPNIGVSLNRFSRHRAPSDFEQYTQTERAPNFNQLTGRGRLPLRYHCSSQYRDQILARAWPSNPSTLHQTYWSETHWSGF